MKKENIANRDRNWRAEEETTGTADSENREEKAIPKRPKLPASVLKKAWNYAIAWKEAWKASEDRETETEEEPYAQNMGWMMMDQSLNLESSG
jgi:hypothetical protein